MIVSHYRDSWLYYTIVIVVDLSEIRINFCSLYRGGQEGIFYANII